MTFLRLRAVGVAIAVTVASLAFGTTGTAVAGTPKTCAALITSFKHLKKTNLAKAEVVARQVGNTCTSVSVLKAAIRKLYHGAPSALINQVATAFKQGICLVLGNTSKLCR
jgi:hypothetical protein